MYQTECLYDNEEQKAYYFNELKTQLLPTTNPILCHYYSNIFNDTIFTFSEDNELQSHVLK